MTTASKAIFSTLALLISSGGITLWYVLPNYDVSLNSQERENSTEIKFSDGDDWFSKSITDKYPELKKHPKIVEEVEKNKREDPVYYRYWYDNPFQRTIEPQEAKEKLSILMDHTMMLSYSSGCPLGTAWIFDYVLPEKNQKYPTKFFLASSGHVVNAIKWDETNPYQQVLSDPEKDLNDDWKKSACFSRGGSEITLIKEKVQHEDSDFNRDNWVNTGRQHAAKSMRKVEDKYNVSKYKENEDNPEIDYWQFTLSKPKLVYFPHNYLGTGHQDHVADFAIFEVDFREENVAKLFTRDFYEKYDRDRGTHKEKALNLFSEPLHKKYTSKQILEKDIQVWMAGYPTIGLPHKASTNYNIHQKRASRFSYYQNIRGRDNRLLFGHMPANSFGEWKWGGREVNEKGYVYVFNYPEVGQGASGSVVITDEGDVLGVYSFVSTYDKIGGATPLRNVELRNKEGKIINYAYDLLEGVRGQNGSYKEQIQKYVLKNKQQTSLSKFRNW